MIYNKNELFYEPSKVYPEQEFEVDGIKVHFHYITKSLPHFQFRGDISETGYQSDFVRQEWLDELGVYNLARKRIEVIKHDFLMELEKRQKRIKRGKQNAVNP